MNKKYMDFVPAKAKEGVKTNSRNRAKSEIVTRRRVSDEEESGARETRGRMNSRKMPELGVIEDLNTNEGETRVRKTRVPRSHFVEEESSIGSVKAKRVGLRETDERIKNRESVLTEKKGIRKTDFKVPKTPFINQDKVVKRPLSKNVYQKKIEVPKEEPKGLVTIITKPEKQAHVSLIVTIILTIILGAAAGTVAFLLLPK